MLSLHPLLAGRQSTRAFDPDADVTSAELAALLEAARWAPSSRNSQPWRFAIGRRDDDLHKRIFATLHASNQRWAVHAPILLVGAHLTRWAEQDLPHGEYDLGLAVAQLTVQATAMGLNVRHMAGFDHRALHDSLGLPADIRVCVVLAIGRRGDPTSLPPDLHRQEVAARERLPVRSLLLV